METLVRFFFWIMSWCHAWWPNWWGDIVVFTLITKVLQFPLSLWCHVNSLKMVAIMPESIRLKIEHYGDSEQIGEKTAALFKRKKYHPLLSLVPLAIQLVILMGFGKVIYAIAAAERGGEMAVRFALFLGLRTLTVIRDCLDLIKRNYGIDMRPEEIPMDDPAVYQMISDGKTTGIFQLESAGMTSFMKELRP